MHRRPRRADRGDPLVAADPTGPSPPTPTRREPNERRRYGIGDRPRGGIDERRPERTIAGATR
ncbi:hypothetical protein BRC97_11370 [Halobacteriales archaeon QS_6_71_20]|nr:MAG: hypothetical protein BRC97_11370 [Halobacteriales archaeon QS_6_71_20]